MTLPARLEGIVRAYMRRRGMKLRRLAEGVDELHHMFTHPEYREPAYMARPRLRQAYAAYFAPVNALRLAAVLSEMRAYTGAFLQGDLDIVDLGAGPGAGLLGILLALGSEPVTIRYTAVDEVRAVAEEIDLYAEIAREILAPKAQVRVRFQTEMPRSPSRLGLCMNALAEFETPETLYPFLDEAVAEQGYSVVMEPALKSSTQRMQVLRDELVADEFRIAAPCPAVTRCPMRARDDLWCHADVPWEGMKIVREVDERVGLHKESLKFSYLVVTRSGHTLADRFNGVARIVSAKHPEKGKMWGEMCGLGPELVRMELLARNRSPQTRDFASGKRGDTYTGVSFEDREAYGRLQTAWRVARLGLRAR